MKDGLSRRELMKALSALPLVGGIIGEVEAAPAKKLAGITPPDMARKVAERECGPKWYDKPLSKEGVWINRLYMGNLVEYAQQTEIMWARHDSYYYARQIITGYLVKLTWSRPSLVVRHLCGSDHHVAVCLSAGNQLAFQGQLVEWAELVDNRTTAVFRVSVNSGVI